MESLAQFTSIVAVIFNITFLSIILYKVIKGQIKSVYILIVVFFIFFVLPNILNHLIGLPNYNNLPGFYWSSIDHKTNIIYNISIIFLPVILYISGNAKPFKIYDVKKIQFEKYKKFIYFILFIFLLSPSLLLLISPDLSSYFNYATAGNREFSDAGASFHSTLGLLSRVSVISFILILLFKRNKILITSLLMSPFILIDFWIYGKRSIVALFLMLLFYTLWQKKVIKGINIAILGISMFFTLLIFSNFYQNEVREKTDNSFEEKYLNFRVDYGRDDVLKLVTYRELNKDQMQVLEYPGQSILFHLTMYIPRSIWEGKPLPYAQYLTSALYYSEPKLWGWGMTTSIFDELLANFGFIGLAFAPLILGFIIRISERNGNQTSRVLGLVICILLMAQHLTAFAPLFFLWLIKISYENLPFKISLGNSRIKYNSSEDK